MKNKWAALCAGIVLMLCAGLVFSWSIFVQPIEAELGFLRRDTSLVFPLSLSVSIGGQILAGLWMKRRPVGVNFLTAAGLFAAGFTLASLCQTLWVLYLSYGLLVGLAIGMVYNSVLSSVALHFGAKANEINGLLLMAFGLGSMALGTLAVGLIESWGWRFTFRVFAVVFGGFSLLGAFFITRPANLRELPGKATGGREVGAKEMARQPQYIFTFLWCTVLTATCLIILGHAALCVADIGATPYLAALASGVVSVSNVAARGIISPLYNRLGMVKARYGLTVLALCGALACLWGYAGSSLLVLVAGYALLGFLNGGCTVVVNSFILEEYGRVNFGINMAITNIHMAIASLLGPAVAGFVRTRYSSYIPAFYIMLGLGAFGLVLCFLAAQKKPRARGKSPRLKKKKR